jgi:hypothetical protein
VNAERVKELREWVRTAPDVYDDPRYPDADEQMRADLLAILDDYASTGHLSTSTEESQGKED